MAHLRHLGEPTITAQVPVHMACLETSDYRRNDRYDLLTERDQVDSFFVICSALKNAVGIAPRRQSSMYHTTICESSPMAKSIFGFSTGKRYSVRI